MAISIKQLSSNEVEIVLGERFDFNQVDEFRRSYEEITVKPGLVLTLNFQNTRYMDSSALGMLINAKTFHAANSIKIRIIRCNEQIKKIFSISRFDQKFDIA